MSSRKKVRTKEPEEKKIYRLEKISLDGTVRVWELDSPLLYANGILTETRGNSVYQYEGEFKNQKPDGKGVEKINGVVFYKGDFVLGKKHGEGVLTDSNGDRYEGGFRNDKFYGEGVYKRGRDVFRGTFRNGHFVAGTQETPFGEYTGDFDHFTRSGHGKMIYKNGSVYEGDWANNVTHGHGVYYSTIKDQTVEGHWIHGNRHGDFVDIKTGEKYLYVQGEEKKIREVNEAKCPNESAISLTAYDENDAKAKYPDDLIYLLLDNRYYCVLRSELKEVMDKQERVYAWIPRPSYPEGCCAYEFLPRFKILEFGWFDAQTYTNLMNPEFNKFRIVDLGLQHIGSAFGEMGALHNAEERIRQAVPVRNVNDRAVPIPEQPVYFQSEKYNDDFFIDRADAYDRRLYGELNDDYPIPIHSAEQTMIDFRNEKGIP